MKYTNSQHYCSRPDYPASLFEALSELAPNLDLAWDVGTGTGQAALGLARHFEKVIASDSSAEQIGHAKAHQRIEYQVSSAEQTDFRAASVSLTTVAAALHWFDFEAFCAEVARVLCPGGILAVWTYTDQSSFSPSVDQVLKALTDDVCAFAQSAHEGGTARYQMLNFPFDEVETSLFQDMTLNKIWAYSDLVSVLRSWSAVQAFDQDQGGDIVSHYTKALAQAWGNPAERRSVSWRVVGRVLRKG